LITKVEEDTGEVAFPLERPSQLEQLKEMMNDHNADDDQCSWESPDGTEYCLQPEGSLAGIQQDQLRTAVNQLVTPCRLVFKPKNNTLNTNTCADDKVTAVNLSRPFVPRGSLLTRATEIIATAKASTVDVTYYRGGPCDNESIVSCLVLGGRRTGYTLVHSGNFKKALLLAKRNAIQSKLEGRNQIAVGQAVVLQHLQQRPDLNGKRGLVQAYCESDGRFEVRLAEEERPESSSASTTPPASQPPAAIANIKRVKPINLKPQSSGIGKNGTVYAFVGDARWTRAQLLGEIAKSSWGLCQAQIPSDLFLPENERYAAVQPRLVYAPISEMSQYSNDNDDNDQTESDETDMVALRRGALEAANYVHGGGGGTDDDDDDEEDYDDEGQ